MKVKPFHSKKVKVVYHDNTECHARDNIDKEYRVPGTGGLRLCSICKKENDKITKK